MIPLGVLAQRRQAAAGNAVPHTGTLTSFIPSIGAWSVTGAADRLTAITDATDSSYVAGENNGDVATMSLGSGLNIAAGETITAVNIVIRKASATAGGSSAVRPILIIGGVDYPHESLVGGTSGSFNSQTLSWTVDPVTSAAWTPAGVNAITDIALYVIDGNPDPWISLVEVTVT